MKICKRMICMALTLLLFAAANAVNASAAGQIKTGIGRIDANRLNLRAGPGTDSAVLATGTRSEAVVIIDKVGSWYKVIYNLKEGYMLGTYVDVFQRENIELGYGKVNGRDVNMRSGPGTNYTSVDKSNPGDQGYIIGFNTGWYKVIYKDLICYIRSDYLDLTQIPYENKASSNTPLFYRGGKSTGLAPSASALNGNGNSTGAKIVADAKKYLGVPYVWGGTTPSGFDCSGLTFYVMRENGITIPRTSETQYGAGTYVSRSTLQPGDLVFFENTYREGISHVGIYIGNGQFIHAASSGVIISNLSSTYYDSRYYGARRVIHN